MSGALAHTALNKALTITSFVQGELQPWLSRENVVYEGGAGDSVEYKTGSVLGRRLFDVAGIVITPGSNTGGGSLGAVSMGKGGQVGDYIAVAVTAIHFITVAPDGNSIGPAEVDVPFVSDDISFTISASGAAFEPGDQFTISVPEGNKNVVLIDFAATDGSQVAYGIAPARYLAPDATDVPGASIKAYAKIIGDALLFPDGTTQEQKDGALAELAEKEMHSFPGY